MYSTMPVQKLPDPTAEGMASEASNRALPLWIAAVVTPDAAARISFA